MSYWCSFPSLDSPFPLPSTPVPPRSTFHIIFTNTFCYLPSQHRAAVTFGIESANVVGYQSVDLISGEYNTGVSTFLQVGKEKTTQTLGAIKLANAASMGSVLQLVAPDGSTPTIEHPELGEVSAMFWYLTEAEYADVGASAPGWYLQDDGAFEYPMNDYPVAAGLGFLIDCSDEAAELVMPAVLAK
jgi:hypothetical protein